MLVGTAIILFVLDWRLALATCAVIPLMSVATAVFRSRSARAYAAVRERLGLVTATLAEDIAGHAGRAGVHARAAGVRQLPRRRANATARRTCRRSSSTASTSRSSTCSRRSRSRSCSATAATSTSAARVTLGTLFAFMLYVQNFFDPVQQLSQLYNTFLSATAALDKIMGVLDEEPEVVDRPGAGELAQIAGHVALRGRPLHVRPRRRGAARDRPRRPRRDDRRARRPHGRRQVDDREAARPLLRADARAASRSTAST